MTIIHLFYAAIPLLFSLFMIAKTGSIYKSMVYSAFLGIAMYTIKIGFETMMTTDAPLSGSLLLTIAGCSAIQAASEGLWLLKSILMDKAPITLATFMLFLMVKLICGSKVIEYINLAADHFVKSRFHFIVIFLGMSVLFSIDDYLCCVGVAAMVSGIAVRQGLSREKTAYMICLLSVAFCTMLPYSSWMPVMQSAVGNTLPLHSVTRMNLAAFFGIFIVIVDVLPTSVSNEHNTKVKSFPDDFGKVFSVLIACIVATAAALILVNLVSDGAWSVTAAGTAGCVVFATMGILLKVVNTKIIPAKSLEAFKETISLFKMLFFVWLTKDICVELLGMNNLLKLVMEGGNVPVSFIPVVIYMVSSGFAYVTGTSFGTFSLFIPLALELTVNSGVELSSAAAAAALAGSLQSVNRPGADVIRLTSDILKCDEKKLLSIQKQGMIRTVPILCSGFSIMGLCANHGTATMLLAGLTPIFFFASFRFLLNRRKVPSTAKESPAWHATHTYNPCDHYFGKKIFTFHQKYLQLEALYTSYLTRISQKATNLSPAITI